ncbi:MAG: tyrosine-type recombinase/integrase [Clostridia bacterium]|nr:tyrosine-type recombinase/integrase [Clostridia bacterium]
MENCGIRCRFYDLRGTFATTALRSGIEMKDIAAVLGHTRIETTENYYISSTEEERRKVGENFEIAMKIKGCELE